MSRKNTFELGEYYHLYNRGVEKRNIFSNSADYDRFLALLYICNSPEGLRSRDYPKNIENMYAIKRSGTLVDLCAYCLMPNHFHLLVREKKDNGISEFMQRMSTAYVMYFNALNERSGSLFQGPFKSRRATDDVYLKYLISYIHLNPVNLIEPNWKEEGIKEKGSAEKYLGGYSYSSYQDFSGVERPQGNILSKGSLPEYFSAPTSFKENIKEWLEYKWSIEQ